MKKDFKMVLVLVLAVVLFCVTAGVVFADTTDSDTKTSVTAGENTSERDVKVATSKASDAPAVYSVVVAWDSLTFTYTFGTNDTWNPSTHQYETAAGTNGFDKTTANIKVTNHSNRAVAVAAKFGDVATATKDGVTATLTGNTFDLATAVGTAVASAPNNTATVTITGNPDVESEITVGKITVTISAK